MLLNLTMSHLILTAENAEFTARRSRNQNKSVATEAYGRTRNWDGKKWRKDCSLLCNSVWFCGEKPC